MTDYTLGNIAFLVVLASGAGFFMRLFIGASIASAETDFICTEKSESKVYTVWGILILTLALSLYFGHVEHYPNYFIFSLIILGLSAPMACLADFDARHHLIADRWLILILLGYMMIMWLKLINRMDTFDSMILWHIIPSAVVLVFMCMKRLLKPSFGIGDGDFKMFAVVIFSVGLSAAVFVIMICMILAVLASEKYNLKVPPLAPFLVIPWAIAIGLSLG